MFTERLLILVDRDRRRRLEDEAAARGTSVDALVREAIDLAFPSTQVPRAAAAAAVLAASAMPVPDTVADLRVELSAVRGRLG